MCVCVFVLVFTHQFISCVARSSFRAHQVSHQSFRWSRIWQEGLLIFSFWCILSLVEFGHSRIETGMVPGLIGMECNQNPVVCLIAVCLVFVCLAIIFTPVTKHKHNTLSSHHQPPTHSGCSSPLPYIMSAHHGLNNV